MMQRDGMKPNVGRPRQGTANLEGLGAGLRRRGDFYGYRAQ